MIPTHQTIKELTKGKMFTPKQAEAIVEVMGQSNDQLATKGDIKDVRGEIKDVRSEIRDVRKDLEVLEGRMDKKFARMETTLTVRMVAALGLLFVALKYVG